jgi:hypothetical protein
MPSSSVRLVPVVDVYDGVLSGDRGGPFREPRWDAFYRGRVVAAAAQRARFAERLRTVCAQLAVPEVADRLIGLG